jgi:hypothetical protein
MSEEPTHEQDEEDQVYVHLQLGQPFLNLNEEPAHEYDEEGQVEVQFHLQQDQPLSEQNEAPAHDQRRNGSSLGRSILTSHGRCT